MPTLVSHVLKRSASNLWGECSRLIPICINFYNATTLSFVLARREQIGDHEGVALLNKELSVAWQNENLQNRFKFGNRPEPIDMEAIMLRWCSAGNYLFAGSRKNANKGQQGYRLTRKLCCFAQLRGCCDR